MSQSSAPGPATIAAVAAAFASAQVAAAALTVRHGPAAGCPVSRVHDVVQLHAPAPPPPAGHRRGGDRAVGQPDELAELRARRSGLLRPLGHGDRPAVAGRRPG